jgi:hypothetical protein
MDCALVVVVVLGVLSVQGIIGLAVFERVRYNLHAFEELGWETVLTAFGRYTFRSIRFFVYGHWKYGDRILSLLCVAQVVIGTALLVWAVPQSQCVR